MQTTRYSVDDLLTIPDRLLATREILAGTFDAEIKRIVAEREALEKKQGIQINLDAAQKAKSDAEADRAAAAKILADAKEEARMQGLAITAQRDQLAATQRDLAALQAKMGAVSSTLDARASVLLVREKELTASAEARESTLKKKEADLLARMQEHAAKVEAFNKRLDLLKITSV